MFFYKYQQGSTLQMTMLRHGEVFFASPKELNDMHECRPQFIFSGDVEIWSRFVYKILVMICIRLNLNPDDSMAKEILKMKSGLLSSLLKGRKSKSLDYQGLLQSLDDAFKNNISAALTNIEKRSAHRAYNDYIEKEFDEELNENYYMSSFSKSANNLTMWGHYGNAEKGFAIIYESTDGNVMLESDLEIFLSFNSDPNEVIVLDRSVNTAAKIMSVDYKNKPVRVNGFRRLINTFIYSDQEADYDYPEELLSRATIMDEAHIGWVKYLDWKYEKELRIHLPVYEELPSSIRSVRINAKHIKGVILGSRISAKDKENIISSCYYLKKSRTDVSELFVFQAKAIPNQYKIKVTAIGRVCDIHAPRVPYIESFTGKNSNLFVEANRIADAINLS